MTVKAQVLETIQSMPDDLTIADVIEELAFRQHVDEGLRELDAGQGIPHEEIKERLTQSLARFDRRHARRGS